MDSAVRILPENGRKSLTRWFLIFIILLMRQVCEEAIIHEEMTGEEFADALAHSLEERKNLLKIMSMNHYDMEENSRIERLIEFKAVYGQSLAEVRNCLDKFFPEMTVQDRQDFIFSFFPKLGSIK